MSDPEIRRRTATVEFSRAGDDDRFDASFSSELPIERIGFTEILDHGPEAVNFERARDGLPLLLDHRTENVIGRVNNFRIDDRKLRGTLRFGKTQLARDVRQDVAGGIRREVSIAYRVDDARHDDGDVVRVTRWTPLEASIVGVPADHTVGVGRSQRQTERIPDMEQENRQPAEEAVRQTDAGRGEVFVRAERKRVEEILGTGELFAKGRHANLMNDAQRFVSEGRSVDEFNAFVLARTATQPLALPSVGSDGYQSDDVFQGEEQQYSLRAAISSVVENKSLTGREAEISQELGKRMGRPSEGFFIPASALVSERAVMATSTALLGGDLVGTTHLSDEFISPLRNVAQVVRLGARVMPGLSANISIPRQTVSAISAWLAEDAAATETDLNFDTVTLGPKQVSARVQYTRKLLLQASPAIEQLVRDDLLQQIGLAIDLAAVNGSGSGNEPLGILNTTGVGTVAGGTDGGAPTYSHVVDLESALADDNADVGTLGYLSNSKVRGKLKKTEKATNTGLFVWEPGNETGFGRLTGHRAAVSNQVPSNLTKGTGTNLSAIIFGNWSDLIVAEFGMAEVIVDPYTEAAKGNVRVVVHHFADIAVRHPQSFSTMVDAITT